jgi:hypothetical protein
VLDAFGYEVGYTKGTVALEKNFDASALGVLEFAAPDEFDGTYTFCTNAISLVLEELSLYSGPIVSTQLPLLTRVVPTQSDALSQTNRHWLGVMYEGWRIELFDDSPAPQWILYLDPPSMSMSSLSQAGHVTLVTSHVGLGDAGR